MHVYTHSTYMKKIIFTLQIFMYEDYRYKRYVIFLRT